MAEASSSSPVKDERLTAWIAPGLTALLGFVAVCVICWPGFMSPDSVDQLIQARHRAFTDAHPPLMAAIWVVVDRILPGPAGMLVLMNALYWGGLLVAFRYWPLSPRARALCFAFVAAFPPLLVNLGVIWKDILMHGALVALLASHLRYRRSHGSLALALALVFSLVAIGARHNAAAAVWPLLALLVAAHPRWSPKLARWKRSLAALVISLGLVLVLQQGLTRAFKPVVRDTNFWQMMALLDLAGMSVVTGELLIDPSIRILHPGTTLDDIRGAYSPLHPGPLFYRWGRPEPIIRHTDDPQRLKAIFRNWLQAVGTHPAAYSRVRWGVYRHMLGLTKTQPAYMVFAEIVRNPYGYRLPESPLRDEVVNAFARLGETFLFRVWLYVLACLILLVVGAAAFWSGGGPLTLALSASGVLYHLTFALLSASSDYRYSLWTILCTILAACALPASVPEHWRARAAGLVPSRIMRRPTSPLSSRAPTGSRGDRVGEAEPEQIA